MRVKWTMGCKQSLASFGAEPVTFISVPVVRASKALPPLVLSTPFFKGNSKETKNKKI